MQQFSQEALHLSVVKSVIFLGEAGFKVSITDDFILFFNNPMMIDVHRTPSSFNARYLNEASPGYAHSFFYILLDLMFYEIYDDNMAAFAEKSLNLPIAMPPAAHLYERPA